MISIWDAASGQRLKQLAASQSCVVDLLYSADGKLLFSSDSAGVLTAWSALTFEQLASTTAPDATNINVLSRTSDRNIFASAGVGGWLRSWRYADNKIELVVARQSSPTTLTTLDWGPGESPVLTGDESGLIVLWDAPLESNDATSFGRHRAAVSAAARNFTGEYLASTDLDGCLMLWNIARREKLFQECEPTALAYQTLDWSPVNDTLAIGTDDGQITFWQIP
jgi:WD40 repeat protein